MRGRLFANLLFNAVVAFWVWHDARWRRARKPLFAAGLALLWGPLGLAFWAAERPLTAGERRTGGTGWTMATAFVVAWSALAPTVFALALPAMRNRAAVPGSLGAELGVVPATVVVAGGLWLLPVVVAIGVGTWLRTSDVEMPHPPAPGRSLPLVAAVAIAGAAALLYAVSQLG
jgi:hypothetical protein